MSAPSGFTTQTPKRSLGVANRNRIFEPSGDHSGYRTKPPGFAASSAMSLPSGFMTYRPPPESASVLRNTTLLPSGDQLGMDSSAGSFVSCRSPDPSAPIAYRSPGHRVEPSQPGT